MSCNTRPCRIKVLNVAECQTSDLHTHIAHCDGRYIYRHSIGLLSVVSFRLRKANDWMYRLLLHLLVAVSCFCCARHPQACWSCPELLSCSPPAGLWSHCKRFGPCPPLFAQKPSIASWQPASLQAVSTAPDRQAAMLPIQGKLNQHSTQCKLCKQACILNKG